MIEKNGNKYRRSFTLCFSSNNADEIINEISRFNLNENLQIVLVILDRFTEKCYKPIKDFINCEIGIS